MKTLLALCLLVILPLLFSCSQSTEPEENPPPPSDEFELIAEADIGPAGGTLEAEGFHLAIPAGALDRRNTLELYSSDTDLPYIENARTKLFRLEGLPQFLGEDLTLTMEHDGNATEGTFIADGLYGSDFEFDEPALIYSFVEAEESSGQLLADISGISPVRQEPVDGRDNAFEMIRFFLGLSGIDSYPDPEQRFNVYWAFGDDAYLSDIAELANLEFVYIIEDWGLPWNADDNEWPIEIEVTGNLNSHIIHNQFNGEQSNQIPKPKLEIPGSYLIGGLDEDFPAALGKSLFVISQFICEGGYSEAYKDRFQIYLHSAFAQWSEEVFTLNPEYSKPVLFSGHEAYPLRGMASWVASSLDWRDAYFHGTGLAPIAKFLVDDPRFGMVGVRNMYADIKLGRDATRALMDAVTVPVKDWLPDFYQSYFLGEIYNVDYNLLTTDPLPAWSPNTGDTVYEIGQGDHSLYRDISAKYIPIHLTGPYSPGTSMKVTSGPADDEDFASDETSVLLFAVEGDSLRFLGKGHDWALHRLQEDFIDQGITELAAVVVCSAHQADYRSSQRLRVRFELDQIETVYVQLITNIWQGLSNYEFDQYRPEYQMSWFGEGDVGGTSFNVPINQTIVIGDYRSEITGHIEGTMNEEFTQLLSLSAESSSSLYHYDVLESTATSSFTLSQAIDCEPGYPGNFWTQGENTCTYVGTLTEIQYFSDRQYWIESWSCDSTSELYIGFSNF